MVVEKGTYVVFVTDITVGANYNNVYPTIPVKLNGTAVDNIFTLNNTEAYGNPIASGKCTAVLTVFDAEVNDVISITKYGRWAGYQIWLQN